MGEGRERWREDLSELLGLLLPASCAGCGRAGRDALCATCRNALGGGLVMPGVPGVIESFLAVGAYAGVAGRAVRALKFHGRRGLADLLGDRLARLVASLPVAAEAVVAVPTNPWRRWRRGHDPALALAQVVARRLELPLRQPLVRRRPGRPQSMVPDRRANVRGAFQVVMTSPGTAWLLVDDVVTSGATALEAALALRQSGASRVWVGAVAHSRPSRQG